MKIYKVEDRLPEIGRYVVVHIRNSACLSPDQEGVEWRVMSRWVDRIKGNNFVEYSWYEAGPHHEFGQNVDLWFELPRSL